MSKDFYSILGVNKHTTKEEIKSAFYKLARRYHPDVNPEESKSGDKFKMINEAYSVLSDDERRKRYDNIRDAIEQRSIYQNNLRHGIRGSKRSWVYKVPKAPKKSKIYSSSRYSTAGNIKFKYSKKPKKDFSKKKIFKDLGNVFDVSSNRMGGTRAKTTRYMYGSKDGDDLRYDVEISFYESFYGTQRNYQYTDPITGQKKNLIIKIKGGIKNNQKILLKGKGISGISGGLPGDFYIVVHVKNHPLYKRKGDDIVIEKEIPFTTAVFGGEIKVSGIERNLIVMVPPRTKDSTFLRLKHKGFFNIQTNKRGDLLVKVRIKVPDRINKFQKKSLENLRKYGL